MVVLLALAWLLHYIGRSKRFFLNYLLMIGKYQKVVVPLWPERTPKNQVHLLIPFAGCPQCFGVPFDTAKRGNFLTSFWYVASGLRTR